MHFVLRLQNLKFLLSVDRFLRRTHSVDSSKNVTPPHITPGRRSPPRYHYKDKVERRAVVLYLNIKYSFSLVEYTLDSAWSGGRKVQGTRSWPRRAHLETGRPPKRWEMTEKVAVGRNLTNIFLHSKKLKTRAKTYTSTLRGHHDAVSFTCRPPPKSGYGIKMFGGQKHTIRWYWWTTMVMNLWWMFECVNRCFISVSFWLWTDDECLNVLISVSLVFHVCYERMMNVWMC